MHSPNPKTCLVVCRQPSNTDQIARIPKDPGFRYILASDDVGVHEMSKQHLWIEEVRWLTPADSFLNVADDVIRILPDINNWLKANVDGADEFPPDLVCWMRFCEGGMTTQRIQDLLLLIRSYQELLNTNVAKIIIIGNLVQWEDRVLLHVAGGKGVSVQLIRSFNRAELKKRAWAWIKNNIAKEIFWTINILRAKFSPENIFGKMQKQENEIALQLCNSALNQIAHILPLMKEFKKRGLNPVALCWNARRGAALIRKKNLRAEELESYVSFMDLIKAPRHARRLWGKAKRRQKEFLLLPQMTYKSVALGPLLWPSIESFFKSEVAQRYRLHSAAANYFKSRSPLAIKLWSFVFLAEGSILYACFKKSGKKAVLFTKWPYFVRFSYPYLDGIVEPGDIEFTNCPRHEKHLKKRGVSQDRIERVGNEGREVTRDFISAHTTGQSRIFLDVGGQYSFYILFDPGVVVAGYHSDQEQIATMNLLLEFARTHKSAAIMIKPHPSTPEAGLEAVIRRFSLPNVFLLDKKNIPYHALNAADVLITKNSTIGIEAMEFKVPVIAAFFGRDERLEIYEDAAEYVYSLKELGDLLTRLVEDNGFKDSWTKKYIQREQEFLSQEDYHLSASTAELMADAIIRKINAGLS